MTLRDPEAASLLIAHVVAKQQQQKASGEDTRRIQTGYDPLELYRYMCKEYGWTPQHIDAMHYPLFFALVEKTNEQNRRENDAANKH